MIYTTDDVLAAIQEKYLTDAKRLFALLRDGYVERIDRVMLILKELLDKKADENTLRQARVLLKQANYVAFVPGQETVFGKATADFVRSYVKNFSEDSTAKREDLCRTRRFLKSLNYLLKQKLRLLLV